MTWPRYSIIIMLIVFVDLRSTTKGKCDMLNNHFIALYAKIEPYLISLTCYKSILFYLREYQIKGRNVLICRVSLAITGYLNPIFHHLAHKKQRYSNLKHPFIIFLQEFIENVHIYNYLFLCDDQRPGTPTATLSHITTRIKMQH